MAAWLTIAATAMLLTTGCENSANSDDDGGASDYRVTRIMMYAGNGTVDRSDDTVLWLQADFQETLVDGQVDVRVQFDENGDGTIDSSDPLESVVERHTTEYGLITMVRSYANLDSDAQYDDLVKEAVYVRGDHGYLSRTIRVDSDRDGTLGGLGDSVPYRQTRTYTAAGRVQKCDTHSDEDRDGTYEFYYGREEFTYNASGDLISVNRYKDFDSDGSVDELESSVTLEYDGQGRLTAFTSEIDTDEDGDLDSSYPSRIEYNASGLPEYMHIVVNGDQDFGIVLTWEKGQGFAELDDRSAFSGGFLELTSWFHFGMMLN